MGRNWMIATRPDRRTHQPPIWSFRRHAGVLARVLSSKNPCQIRHRSMDLDRGSLLAGPDLVSAAMRPGQECSWAYEPLRNLAHRACHAVPSANVQYG
jgi:predicted nicotinamide N-methyase